MRRAGWMAAMVGLALSTRCQAGERVSIPWDELKSLYREHVEKGVMDRMRSVSPDTRPPVWVIDEAVYRVKVALDAVQGQVRVSGRVIEGKPAAIPVLGPEAIVTAVRGVSGGVLAGGSEQGTGVMLIPAGPKPFQVEIDFMLQPRDREGESQEVVLTTPRGLRSSLHVEPGPDVVLLETPGIQDESGAYRLAATGNLVLRFSSKEARMTGRAPEIDVFTSIRFRGQRTVLASRFVAARAPERPLELRVPAGAKFTDSSLASRAIAVGDAGTWSIDLPKGTSDFVVEMEIDRPTGTNAMEMVLPSVAGNRGREGLFVVEEPDGAELTFAGQGLARDLSAERLPAAFRTSAGVGGYCHLPGGRPLRLELRQFEAVSTPPLVLDTMQWFTAFEENGGILSMLRMEVPPHAGQKLSMAAVPGVDVWAVRVNGAVRTLYAGKPGTWVVPLDAGKACRVELVLVSRGERLGLHGKLETELPRTDIPVRSVVAGIALPARVDLLSLEGPVSPDPQVPADLPKEFIGRPHFFSRAFYGGDGMKLAVSYKEPVKDGAQRGKEGVE